MTPAKTLAATRLVTTGKTYRLGIDNLYFNCNRAADFAMVDGLTNLGIENVPAVPTRGIVLDMAGYFGADNPSVEVIPFEQGAGVFEVHQVLLAQNGIHILENINTAELVDDRAWEFLFTLGAAQVTGAVQAIINPVAIR